MTIGITLGGATVQDAIAEARNLSHLGYPAPPEFARANSLLNPLGEAPARGWFLLLWQDLNPLEINALQTLSLADDYGNAISIPGLVIAREPSCITPSGNSNDPNACYLVEVADARWRCHNHYFSITANKQYNVRAPGWGGQYYAATMNGGSAWSWDGMIGDLWGLLSNQLGDYPGLPQGFNPDGVPERYRFLGVSAWRSLCQVLAKLGLAVAWQATKGKYVIVQIGATDTTTANALQAASGSLIFDRQYPSVVRGRVPAGVRVHFHRVQEHYGSEPATAQDSTQFITSNVYTVDVAGTAAQTKGAEPGTYHPLWDDLPALYDPAGTLLNSAALSTRAQNRASAYYAMLLGSGGGRRQQLFSGLVAVNPGSTLRGVCWRQDLQSLGDPGGDGGGMVTEVLTWPTTQVRVADNGQFEERLEESSALHPPDLRVKEPVWPDLLHVVQVTAATSNSDGTYPAQIQAYDPDTQAWLTRETCKVLPINDMLPAVLNSRHKCRLIGADDTGIPIWGTELDPEATLQVDSSAPVPIVLPWNSTSVAAFQSHVVIVGPPFSGENRNADWLISANGNFPSSGILTGGNFYPAPDSMYLAKFLGKTPDRTVTDVVATNSSAVITSATANFTQADVNATISFGATDPWSGYPSLSIVSVQSSTQATLSNPATFSATGVSMTIYGRRIWQESDGARWQIVAPSSTTSSGIWSPAGSGLQFYYFAAEIFSPTSVFTNAETCWLASGGGAGAPIGAGVSTWIMGAKMARTVGADANGVPIYLEEQTQNCLMGINMPWTAWAGQSMPPESSINAGMLTLGTFSSAGNNCSIYLCPGTFGISPMLLLGDGSPTSGAAQPSFGIYQSNFVGTATVYLGEWVTGDRIGDTYSGGLLTSLGSNRWVSAPAHNTSSGVQHQLAVDGNYLYVCVSTNSWVRIALTAGSW